MELREELLLLNEQNVLSLLTPSDAIAAAEDVFLHIGLGKIKVGNMAVMNTDVNGKNNLHSMPAVLHHKQVAGVKWINSYSDPIPGYPFSHGNLVILSHIRTGSPIAVVGATNITEMRTAGGHGVVQAKYLCNPEPPVLTVIGCGAQGKAGIKGFLTQFPSLKQIRLFSRSSLPMTEVKEELKNRVEVILCESPEKALQGSNLVLMASGSRKPLVTPDMVRPGMTIIGIAGFRDLDSRIGKQADKWYLGFKKPDATIFKNPAHNPWGFLTEQDVFGDMTELLTNKVPGRERESELIVSTHMGMGAHDVNCAFLVYERARKKGIGQKWALV